MLEQGKIAATEGSSVAMNKDDIQLLFEYDRWANNSVLQSASTRSGEEFTRVLRGSLAST